MFLSEGWITMQHGVDIVSNYHDSINEVWRATSRSTGSLFYIPNQQLH